MDLDAVDTLDSLEDWTSRNTLCITGSQYAKQTRQCVAKYLRFLGENLRVETAHVDHMPRGAWAGFYDTSLLERWVEDRAVTRTASSVFNDLTAIQRAAVFLSVKLRWPVPADFKLCLDMKKKRYGRLRRTQDNYRLEMADRVDRALISPKPAVQRVKRDIERYHEIARYCRQLLDQPTPDRSLNVAEQDRSEDIDSGNFLYALRVTMSFMAWSMALRPSAVYNLRMSHTHGCRFDEPVLLIRHLDHKTGWTRGASRIVLSGLGLRVLKEYLTCIRPAALRALGIPHHDHVFFNTNGKALNSNTTNKHLKALQTDLGIRSPLNCTEVRQFVTTNIHVVRDADDHREEERTAASLNHSVQTSRRFYRMGTRDVAAVKTHEAIVRLLGL